LSIGVRVRHRYGLSAGEIAEVMRWHAANYSTPLQDEPWILKTSLMVVQKYPTLPPELVETSLKA
jgi:hypothetical protein